LSNNVYFQDVTPIKPVAPYLGGKSRLAKLIVKRINETDHKIYAEVFVGMGGIFLRRDQKPKAEVINDYNQELATFYRILQRHYVAFMDMMKFQLTTRVEFDRLVDTNPATLTDLERAARFFYLQRTAFGGKVSGHNFGVSADRPGRFDITKLATMLEDLHTRLSGVVIEALSYQDFIRRYDRPDILFYLDPPYYGNENDYGKDLFSREDFETMAMILENIKGRFILSLNDRPEVREIFKAFQIDAVTTTYSIAANQTSKAGEVLISN
jgi:DNA adenine methylase